MRISLLFLSYLYVNKLIRNLLYTATRFVETAADSRSHQIQAIQTICDSVDVAIQLSQANEIISSSKYICELILQRESCKNNALGLLVSEKIYMYK